MHDLGHRSRAVPQTRTLHVYTRLKEQILRLELAPGSSMTEAELANEFGVSKTPVREALAHLQREALVEVVGRTGYRVTAVTLKQARDLFELRVLLDGEAAALAAVNLSDVARLCEAEGRCRSGYRSDDPGSIIEFLDHNTELHATVGALGGNDRLAVALHGVLEELERYFRLALSLTHRSEEMAHEHSELVHAILRHDPDGARRAAIDQCRASQAMVLGALASSETLATTNIVASADADTLAGSR
jgi:DNA-binding GntR family transcriptional regulator